MDKSKTLLATMIGYVKMCPSDNCPIMIAHLDQSQIEYHQLHDWRKIQTFEHTKTSRQHDGNMTMLGLVVFPRNDDVNIQESIITQKLKEVSDKVLASYTCSTDGCDEYVAIRVLKGDDTGHIYTYTVTHITVT